MTFEAIEHRDGIWWYEAPRPPEDHHCDVWTSGWSGAFQVVRCACGARCDGLVIKAAREVDLPLDDQDRLWLERNSRRRP